MRPVGLLNSIASKLVARRGFPLTLVAAFSLAMTVSGPRSVTDGVSSAFASPSGSGRSVSIGPDAAPSSSTPVAPAYRVPVAPPELLGLSGRLRAVMGTEDALVQNPLVAPLLAAPSSPGVSSRWPRFKTPDGDSLTVVTLEPLAEAGTGGYARYHVGHWPSDGIASKSERYAIPNGFIGVTPANQGTRLSSNFTMRDFLTHDQGNVWPKILVLQPRLLDKLELLRTELEREGLPNQLHIMSGFRTPQYNAQGVGKGGRAEHSRHMYGDAADVFVDADRNGMMDDLNGDGKVTLADAKVLREAVERVEHDYPELVGGLSAYPANSAHGPFVHVDARGVKARW